MKYINIRLKIIIFLTIVLYIVALLITMLKLVNLQNEYRNKNEQIKILKQSLNEQKTQKLIEYYLNMIETDGINAFCKNVKRKGYIYADYIGETIS